MPRQETVQVAEADLQAAWMILENLAVSLQQFGSAFGRDNDPPNGADRERAFLEALAEYFTPDVVKAITSARGRVGQYISGEDAEALTETIPYWDYARLEKTRA